MNAAVLGMGMAGRGHARLLLNCEGIEQVHAFDVVPDAVNSASAELGLVAAPSLEAVLLDPEIRLVVVATSNDAHAELATRALEAGKAVLCEKPMANSLDDARTMVEAVERTDGWLQIGFELRYSTLYEQVHTWIADGLLGRVRNVQCTYIASEGRGRSSWRNLMERGGSMMGEKLSHYVDVPRWWVGRPVVDVYTACAPNVVPYYECHDNYHCTYRFDDDTVSHLTFAIGPAATFTGNPKSNMVTQQRGDGHQLSYFVYGTEGAAETNVFDRTIKRWRFGENEKGFTSELVETLTWPEEQDQSYYHNGEAQNRDVVRRVLEGLPPATPAHDALDTMKLCFAADLSADQSRLVALKEFD